MSTDVPAFAQHWGLLPLFPDFPYIVPVGERAVQQWQRAYFEGIDWPNVGGMSTAEAMRYKAMLIRPFAQTLMPLQSDYVSFRRHSLAAIDHSKQAHAVLAQNVQTLAANDLAIQSTNARQDGMLAELSSCSANQANTLDMLSERVRVLESKLEEARAKVSRLESENLDLRHRLPWDFVDPRSAVSLATRISMAQEHAERHSPFGSASNTPFISRCPSRSSSIDGT